MLDDSWRAMRPVAISTWPRASRLLQALMDATIIGSTLMSTLLPPVVVPVLYSYLVRERRPVA